MTTIGSSCTGVEKSCTCHEVNAKKHSSKAAVKFEDKPDTFEKNDGTTVKKLAFAGITTSAALPGIKKAANALPGKIEGFAIEVAKDFKAENFKMPKNFNPTVKYAALAAGTIGAFAFAMKDSDNDGQLDLVEAAKKFFQPG